MAIHLWKHPYRTSRNLFCCSQKKLMCVCFTLSSKDPPFAKTFHIGVQSKWPSPHWWPQWSSHQELYSSILLLAHMLFIFHQQNLHASQNQECCQMIEKINVVQNSSSNTIIQMLKQLSTKEQKSCYHSIKFDHTTTYVDKSMNHPNMEPKEGLSDQKPRATPSTLGLKVTLSSKTTNIISIWFTTQTNSTCTKIHTIRPKANIKERY